MNLQPSPRLRQASKKILTILLLPILLSSCTWIKTIVYDREYKSKDPKKCEAMMFRCKKDQRGFFDDSGCGCEKK